MATKKMKDKTNEVEHIIQICSGITRGRVLNGELYAQRLQMLLYMHLSTDSFMTISLHSSRPREVEHRCDERVGNK